MNPIFLARIARGLIIFGNPQAVNNHLKSLEGKDAEVIIRVPKKGRSNPQNRYYWAVPIKLISEGTGYTTEETHDALRMLFLLDRDRKVPTLRSTTALTTLEMEEYLSKIRNWASMTLSIYVPEPNEVDY